MAKYIDREAFLAQERAWYCDNCDRRKNSKGKTVYEIGEAPCRSCDIGDVLDLLEDYPAADVVERKTGEWEEVEIKWSDDDDPDFKIGAVASMRCPVCERYHNEVYHYGDPIQMARFCGFCGAKMMRGDEH